MSQGLRLAAAQRLRPDGPGSGIELAAQLGVKRVVGEPARLGAAELFILRPLQGQMRLVAGGGRSAVEKVSRGFVEQRQLALLDLLEVDGAAAPAQAGDAFRVRSSPSRRGIPG